MNYLAHAYLSFMHEEILVGNMISDFVKGKAKLDYPAAIQKGITLHRDIDTFTDAHSITKAAKEYFRPAVGLYAGAFMDVVYDHFLANDATAWQEQSLQTFAANTYTTLEHKYNYLPPKFRQMLPYMKQYDWLYNYHSKQGTEKSFEGLARRAMYLHSASAAYESFEKNYETLASLSYSFLPDVKKFASARLNLLLNT